MTKGVCWCGEEFFNLDDCLRHGKDMSNKFPYKVNGVVVRKLHLGEVGPVEKAPGIKCERCWVTRIDTKDFGNGWVVCERCRDAEPFDGEFQQHLSRRFHAYKLSHSFVGGKWVRNDNGQVEEADVWEYKESEPSASEDL